MRCTWCLNTLAKGNNCKITGSFCIGVKCKPHYLLEWLCIMHFLICTLTKYYSGDQIKKNKMHGACMGDTRGAYTVLAGKPEEK